jgi:hypothetical protein
LIQSWDRLDRLTLIQRALLSAKWITRVHRKRRVHAPQVGCSSPRSPGVDLSVLPSLLSDGLPGRVTANGSVCLLSQHFE